MILQGRDLSIRMKGPDVEILQHELQQLGFVIPPEEASERLFGQGTRTAVREFQKRQGIEPTGVVDEETARRINTEVDALQPRQFIVKGQVRRPDGSPLPDVVVRAVDRDLRREEPLGETVTDANGRYEITYTADQFARAEKRTADLIVRAFDSAGQELAASETLFNAPAVAEIDLVVLPRQEPTLSEYERLLAELAPVLEDVQPAELTAEDIDFLVGETGLEQRRIELLAEAGRLAQGTGLPAEAFYGWGRLDFALELESLLEQAPEPLREALQRAIAEQIIPAGLRESLNEIMERLEQLRIERGFLVARQVVGRLVDQDTETPLAGFTVRASDLDAGPEPRDLGHDISDGNGLFAFVYFVPRDLPEEDEEEEPGRRFRIHVLGPEGEEIHEDEIRVPIIQAEVVEVHIRVPKREEPTFLLAELADTVELDLPAELLSVLAGHGIESLADIRREGGIRHFEGVDPDHPAVPVLEAHARLSSLSTNLEANATLIEAGYDSIPAIAGATRVDVVGAANEVLGDFGAARLRVEADALKQFLNNVIAAFRADRANGLTTPSLDGALNGEVAALFPDTCGCRDCDAAVSPMAYLAELLDYTVTYLKRKDGQGETSVTLADLGDRFHQFFGDLPASCEEAERRVRQVRICIEVLRRYLTAKGLPADGTPEADALARDYRAYLVEAYTALLTRIGTSFEEIRLARTAGLEERVALANRLGIVLDPARPDLFDALLLAPKDITEQALEQLFGLADTTRDPLSEGAKLGDDPEQISRWNLNGVMWNRHTDPDGTIYLRLTGAPAGNIVKVELFRDRDRTELVASGERPTGGNVPVVVVAEDGSDFSGRFEIDFLAVTDSIEIVAVPHFLSARLQYLRKLWLEQDWPEDPYTEGAETRLPIIDPDVIGLDDLRTPEVGDAAFDLWLKRREWVDDRLAELAGLTKTVTDGEGNDIEVPDVSALFDRMYQPLTYDTAEEMPWQDTTPPTVFTTLRDTLIQGSTQEVTAAVKRLKNDLRLTVEEFNQLIAIRDKAARWETDSANEQVKDEEWQTFFFILVQAQKRAFHPTWIGEEQDQDVKLGPKQFWISLGDPIGESTEARHAWQHALLRRSQAPLIDPDLILPDDLRDALSGKTAELWQARHDFIKAQLDVLATDREAEATDLAGFDTIFENSVGVPAAELDTLAEQRSEGQDITRRLEQLQLSNEAFDYLLRIRRLAEDGAPILDQEWEDVSSILVQVRKQREFAVWQEEERDPGITLSPDYFKIPEPPPLVFPPPESKPLPAWRATNAARRDWQRTLQARIDQEQTVIEALREAVNTTEQEVLPQLRDALILASEAEGISLDAKAKWTTDQLLIDARVDGCLMTTRVAQAIETLQLLLWSVRTGQLQDAHPDLVLDADDFDKAWEWIGSYETWRAAILVFLYPENILLPSLRKWQTPTFRELVQETRANARLTPEAACELAKRYSDYFYDVCHLSLEASCQTLTRIYRGEGCRELSAAEYRHLFYMFARVERTDAVYWSAYDPDDETGYAQSFWTVVPGLKNVVKILGAVPYQIALGQRFIFLFAQTLAEDRQELVFSKYDLETGDWDAEPTPLELPEDSKTFTAAVEQRNNESVPPHIAIHIEDHGIFSQKLNLEGTAWDDVESRVASTDSRVKKVLSLVGIDTGLFGGLYFVVVERRPGKGVQVGSFLEARPDRPIENWTLVGGGTLVGAFQHSSDLYVFLKANSGVRYGRRGVGDLTGPITLTFSGPVGLDRIAVHCGETLPSPQKRVAYQKSSTFIHPWHVEEFPNIVMLATTGSDTSGFAGSTAGRTSGLNPMTHARLFHGGVSLYHAAFTRGDNGSLTDSHPTRVAPHLSGPFQIPERQSEAQLQVRRNQIRQAFDRNAGAPASVLAYLEEAYYFVPVHLALQLQRRGHFVSALDWLRTVYDYSAAAPVRKISHYLTQEESLTHVFERVEEWWLDPLNPHEMARTRANTYTRFTVLSLIRCLLAFADAEFTRDTAESIPRARTLYMTALDLLELAELKQDLNVCDQVIGNLDIDIGPQIEPPFPGTWHEIIAGLRQIRDRNVLEVAIADVRTEIVASNGETQERLASARKAVAEAVASQAGSLNLAQVLERKRAATTDALDRLLRQPVVANAVARLSTAAAQDFGLAVSAVSGISTASLDAGPVVIPWLGVRADALVTTAVPVQVVETARKFTPSYLPATTYRFCIPPNPITSALRLHAELNLYKMRTCRNIAGDERQLEPYAAPTNVESGLPAIGTGGGLVLPGTITFLPTPYRYAVLIERAKQLVSFAQQIEATFLATLEKRDAEYYHLLKARQEVRLSRAGVRLQDLRVREAEGGVKLAELQQGRTLILLDHFDSLLREGKSANEKAALAIMGISSAIQGALGVGSLIAAPFTGGASLAAFGVSQLFGGASSSAQFFLTLASFERREQDWQLQKQLAEQDIRVGDQQRRIAQDRVRVVAQERVIAEMHVDHAEATADFLATKFTNVGLYDWMSGVLEGVYGFFLQQATSMAKLAENQLAFERQEIPPAFIQADYWEAPLGLEAGGMDGAAPDRRGLTGSARLLQDIFRLDQHAFETDKRKLQPTKTISLAALAPAEFQRFRENGVLRFNTAMELFDRDFPGHYLRLIKSVRTSVIALIPPTQGIRAILSTTGLSRVVTGSDGLFPTVLVRRTPDSVALSSPMNATGLFELTPQTGEMLFPFEGMGVDTAWEFQMPKAANQFDYRTIADVLLTIEYTALNSFAYRRQVIQELDDTIRADRPFSFRQEFADQWYDLNHPDLVDPNIGTPMVVKFTTRREDFPPNIDELRIQHVVLFFARKQGATFDIPATLTFQSDGSPSSSGGSATSIDGIISTRRGNAPTWTAIVGGSPAGTWTLNLDANLSDGRPVREAIKNEEIEDILFVITYQGRTPTWPA